MEILAEAVRFFAGGRQILQGIDLELRPKEFLGIIGPNGSGKSTFLKCVYRVQKPTTGKIYFNGKKLDEFSYRESALKLAVVAQHNFYNFDFSVLDVVLMGRSPHKKMMERDNAEDYKIARDALRVVGLEEFGERNFSTLSGGEQQRVILARALTQQTECLVLDEPTNHLDIPTREIMEKAIQAFGGTCLIVSHDRYFLDKVVTRTLELDNGRLTEYLGNYTYYKEKKKDLEEFEKDRGNAKIAKTPAKMTVSKAEPKKVEKKGISIAAAKKLEQVEMEIARQEATVKMYTFRMNSEPENYAALTEEYKDAEEKLAKLYERWDAIAEDM